MTHAVSSEDDAAHHTRDQDALRVLVVDDNSDMVRTLVALLADEGHDTKGAHDGNDALIAIAEFDPDAVIIDIAIPGVSGWDVAKVVRRIGAVERPLLIAMSGAYTKGADRVLSQMSGFNHFLAKPFEPQELISLLAALKKR